MTKADLKGKLRKRVMQSVFGGVTEDYVCCLCLAIIPEPSEGCPEAAARRP